MAWGYFGFPRYVSKAEKIRKAEQALKKLRKKGVSLEPVTVDGRVIAKSWWGRAWADNLERYSDYENRLPRGRSYVRSGAVLDLKIRQGTITALVAGSRATPYKITVTITSLDKKRLAALQKKSMSSLDSLHLLLSGEFPADLKNDFFKQGSGLFPTPKEIKLDCSCPDWADMCKHVAAALYGAAVRLDEKPELFFLLRGIDVKSFIGTAVADEGRKMAKKAARKTARTLSLEDSQMEALFGISLETPGNKTKSAPSKMRRLPAKKKTVVSRKKTADVNSTASRKGESTSKKVKGAKSKIAVIGKPTVKKTSVASTKKSARSVKNKTAPAPRKRKEKSV